MQCMISTNAFKVCSNLDNHFIANFLLRVLVNRKRMLKSVNIWLKTWIRGQCRFLTVTSSVKLSKN